MIRLIKFLIKLGLIIIVLILTVRLFPDFIIFIGYFLKTYYKHFLIAFILNFFIYRYWFRFIIYRNIEKSSMAEIQYHLGDKVSIGVVGFVGSDKSSISVYLTQVLEMVRMAENDELLHDIYMVLSYLDFNKIINYFLENYDPLHVYKTYEYHELAIESIYFTQQQHLIYVDDEFGSLKKHNIKAFKDHNVFELIGIYFEEYYIKFIRGNNIIANIGVESINTGKNAMPMKESLIQMYRPNDLALEKSLIMLEDEKGITDNSRISSRRDGEYLDHNQDGKDIWYMAIRHLGEQRILHININQKPEDVTAFMRRLYQVTLNSYTSEELYMYRIEINMIRKIVDLLELMENRYYNYHVKVLSRLKKDEKIKRQVEKIEGFKQRDNGYKLLIRKLLKLSMKLKKVAYKRNLIGIHQKIDDVDKDIFDPKTKTRSYAISVFYDLNNVYSKYNTHALSYLRDIRNESARIPLSLLKPFGDLILTEEDYLNMQYTNFNRILESLRKNSLNSNDVVTRHVTTGKIPETVHEVMLD